MRKIGSFLFAHPQIGASSLIVSFLLILVAAARLISGSWTSIASLGAILAAVICSVLIVMLAVSTVVTHIIDRWFGDGTVNDRR